MEKEHVLKALKTLRDPAQNAKRNFAQTCELIINFKDLDIKKVENQVELFIILQHGKGKKNKICALVGPELADEAKKVCDFSVEERDFDAYAKDKRKTKKLASQYDFFIAQANIMPKVAASFGRVFGPRRRMPNPKAGCVIPPKSSLEPLYKRLQDTIKVIAKERPFVQVPVGTEKLTDDQLAENILNVYKQLLHKLPGEKNNIEKVALKFTMGKPVKLEV